MDSRTFFSFALTPVAVAILSMPAMAADTLPATPDAVAAAPAVTQGAVPDVLLAQVAPVPESMPAGSVPAAGTASASSEGADYRVVVTGAGTGASKPLTVVTDPRKARQPIPAQDGADILKTVPGFSVIRKGGTDGDPVLRGMAGSRLNVLLDGEHILGGCGGRMDPPTAYVFPDSYDRLTVLKGPQTVLHGPGNSAGTVLFERDREARPEQPGLKANVGGTVGSFGRRDVMGDLNYATPDFYVRGTGTHTRSDDYKDGSGNPVHSSYERWSGRMALGLTPDANTLYELTYGRSDGEAAYADRMMDGTKFDRENIGLRFEKRNISPLVRKVEANAYRNYVDHVMDNFSMRPATPAAMRALSNPDRETIGARVAVTLQSLESTRVIAGVDAQENQHTLRMSKGVMAGTAYEAMPRMEDGKFRQLGLFGEVHHNLDDRQRLIGGARVDWWEATDQRMTPGLATRGLKRDDTLPSGFLRWERDFDQGNGTVYAGLGHVQRFPDFWETVGGMRQSTSTNSAFNTRPEKTTQLDVGVNWKNDRLSTSLSTFYNRIDDYILIDAFNTGARFGKVGNPAVVRNIDASSYGLEAALSYALTPQWKLDASLAYVRGKNRTDGTPLAQMPPLEGKLGLNWNNGTWSAGALWRVAARQDRVDPGKGNIAGQDVATATPGFGTLSLNGSYKVNKRVRIIAGVDNVFDKTYAEHLSRSGTMIPGYIQTGRINEPGRNWWLKTTVALD